jgi:hypothetical protein
VTEALYTRDGEGFLPTDLVRSPWSIDQSHAGPPGALLVRALERVEPRTLHLVRITIEIMRPIPVAPVSIATSVIKPGRKAQLLGAELSSGDGIVLARATAWRLREREAIPGIAEPERDRLASPSTGTVERHRFAPWTHFPVDATEFRTAGGSMKGSGPAAVWFRLKHPIVAGETPSPEQRFVCAADSANGISAYTGMQDLLFVNTDLTVYFARRPRGRWVGLDSRSYWEPTGRGLSDSGLYDEIGYVGRSNQALFIDTVREPGRDRADGHAPE